MDIHGTIFYMNDLSMTGLILAGGRGARMGGIDKG